MSGPDRQLPASELLAVHRAAMEAALVPMAITDFDGVVLYVNPAFAELWRFEHPDDAIGLSAFEFVVDPDEAAEVARAIAVDGQWNGEVMTRLGDGTLAEIEVSGALVRDADGNPLRVIGSFLDVTDQRAAEAQLRATTARLEDAQRLARMGSWDHEVDTGELTWSAEVYRIFGLDPATFVPTSEVFAEMVHPDDREMLRTEFQRLFEGGATYDVEHSVICPDGRIVRVREHGRAVRHPSGRPIRFVGIVQDVTAAWEAKEEIRALNVDLERRIEERTRELVAARDVAESANRAKSVFLANVSHELRTPLSAVIGYAQLLELDERLPDSLQGEVDQIRRAGEQLLGIVNDLLDLARIESGRLELRAEPVAVDELVDVGFGQIRPLAETHDVSLQRGDGLIGTMVRADSLRVRQVLNNLLSNAVKYNRPGGSVTVSAVASGETVRVRVTDTGRGVSADRWDDLFEPFNRLEQELGAIEGTGIGLAIVRRLVEDMDGRIGVESTVGEGSTFWFELPGAP